MVIWRGELTYSSQNNSLTTVVVCNELWLTQLNNFGVRYEGIAIVVEVILPGVVWDSSIDHQEPPRITDMNHSSNMPITWSYRFGKRNLYWRGNSNERVVNHTCCAHRFAVYVWWATVYFHHWSSIIVSKSNKLSTVTHTLINICRNHPLSHSPSWHRGYRFLHKTMTQPHYNASAKVQTQE